MPCLIDPDIAPIRKSPLQRLSWRFLTKLIQVLPSLSLVSLLLLQIAVHTPSSPALKVVDIQGKGKGVVAMRDLKEGDLLFVEKPAVVIEWEDYETLSEEQRVRKLENQIAELSQQQREDYYSLHIATPRSHYPKPLAIYHSNAIGFNRERKAGGVFLEGSRFNHSCRHSAQWAWDPQEESMHFTLNRDVKEGEEITVCYMEPLETSHTRQMELKCHYGFMCRCEVCTLPWDRRAESDKRRMMLSGILDYLSLPPSLNDIPLRYHALCIQGLKLLEEEDLRLDLEVQVAYAGLMLSVIYGYHQTAQLWIDRLLVLQRQTYGLESIKFKMFELLKEDPTCHPAWRFMQRHEAEVSKRK